MCSLQTCFLGNTCIGKRYDDDSTLVGNLMRHLLFQDFIMPDSLTVLNHYVSTSDFQRVLPCLTTPGGDVTGRAQTGILCVVRALLQRAPHWSTVSRVSGSTLSFHNTTSGSECRGPLTSVGRGAFPGHLDVGQGRQGGGGGGYDGR